MPDQNTLPKVSLISVGPARGHVDPTTKKPVFVDPTTLDQIMVALGSRVSIKVREDHGSGVGETLGFVDNFVREGNQIFGDLHFYDNAESKELLMEIAQKNPDHLGLSLEFSGKDEETPDMMLSRCSLNGVLAVALVSDPAANKSLFSALHPETKHLCATPMPTPGDKDDPATLPDLATLAAQMTEMSKKFDALNELSKSLSSVSEMSSKLTELSKKYDDMAKKFESGKPGEQPADQNKPGETKLSDADAEKISEMSAKAVVKQFSAQFGNVFVPPAAKADTKLPDADAGNEPVKKFNAIVDGLTTGEFKGDRQKALVAAMNRHPAEYGATRLVAPKK